MDNFTFYQGAQQYKEKFATFEVFVELIGKKNQIMILGSNEINITPWIGQSSNEPVEISLGDSIKLRFDYNLTFEK